MKTSVADKATTNDLSSKKEKWADYSFVNEMKERQAAYDRNEIQTFSWTEVKAEAKAALENRKPTK